ncbi:hypothetical protein M0R45_001096 [Rubus argutus]|uniref:Uncharacterized protein n=1 Tax=Rubus argutus TaxID=59490 RepID=A0AAW1VNZ4_RUBAR
MPLSTLPPSSPHHISPPSHLQFHNSHKRPYFLNPDDIAIELTPKPAPLSGHRHHHQPASLPSPPTSYPPRTPHPARTRIPLPMPLCRRCPGWNHRHSLFPRSLPL